MAPGATPVSPKPQPTYTPSSTAMPNQCSASPDITVSEDPCDPSTMSCSTSGYQTQEADATWILATGLALTGGALWKARQHHRQIEKAHELMRLAETLIDAADNSKTTPLDRARNLSLAMQRYGEAAQIYQMMKKRDLAASALVNATQVLDLAEKAWQVSFSSHPNATSVIPESHMALGDIAHSRGDRTTAREHYGIAYSLYVEQYNQLPADIDGNLGLERRLELFILATRAQQRENVYRGTAADSSFRISPKTLHQLDRLRGDIPTTLSQIRQLMIRANFDSSPLDAAVRNDLFFRLDVAAIPNDPSVRASSAVSYNVIRTFARQQNYNPAHQAVWEHAARIAMEQPFLSNNEKQPFHQDLIDALLAQRKYQDARTELSAYESDHHDTESRTWIKNHYYKLALRLIDTGDINNLLTARSIAPNQFPSHDLAFNIDSAVVAKFIAIGQLDHAESTLDEMEAKFSNDSTLLAETYVLRIKFFAYHLFRKNQFDRGQTALTEIEGKISKSPELRAQLYKAQIEGCLLQLASDATSADSRPDIMIAMVNAYETLALVSPSDSAAKAFIEDMVKVKATTADEQRILEQGFDSLRNHKPFSLEMKVELGLAQVEWQRDHDAGTADERIALLNEIAEELKRGTAGLSITSINEFNFQILALRLQLSDTPTLQDLDYLLKTLPRTHAISEVCRGLIVAKERILQATSLESSAQRIIADALVATKGNTGFVEAVIRDTLGDMIFAATAEGQRLTREAKTLEVDPHGTFRLYERTAPDRPKK